MKKTILLLSAFVLCLSACQKEEEDFSTSQLGNEIRFGVSGVSVQTKTYTESTASTIDTNGFKVAGVQSDSTEMFNKVASKGSGKSYYEPADGPFYYPNSGNMAFYAAYPQTETVTITSGAATLEYTSDGEKDLIVAMATDVASSSSSVALTFDHALCLIKFKAKGTDTAVKYKVTSIKVKVPQKNTYTYSTEDWGTATTDSLETTYMSTSTAISTSEATALTGAMTALPSNAKITVSWETYTQTDALIAQYTDVKMLGSNLEMGKATTITLNLPNADAVPITFTVSVNAWVDADKTVDF